ncbi:uncharacterized protein LOC127254752 isoform X2 [Andrographis paniculata]|uniref:uncharacterized protein LOC127254752 isoform X2 n=1 Tax=Andrographis paniculata TaxID=175694 RepID=UPI0021E8FEDE|nr:uncharacterized protein LOC127254752 isoform X2 [Andrographis paniculata]
MAQPSRAGGPANHALVEQPWFIHQTGFLASLELKDAEVRAYRTDPVQVRQSYCDKFLCHMVKLPEQLLMFKRARDTCLGGVYALACLCCKPPQGLCCPAPGKAQD